MTNMLLWLRVLFVLSGLCHQQILGFKIPLNKILLSKQNVVLRRREIEALKFGLIKGVDKGRITTMKDFESWLFKA